MESCNKQSVSLSEVCCPRLFDGRRRKLRQDSGKWTKCDRDALHEKKTLLALVVAVSTRRAKVETGQSVTDIHCTKKTHHNWHWLLVASTQHIRCIIYGLLDRLFIFPPDLFCYPIPTPFAAAVGGYRRSLCLYPFHSPASLSTGPTSTLRTETYCLLQHHVPFYQNSIICCTRRRRHHRRLVVCSIWVCAAAVAAADGQITTNQQHHSDPCTIVQY